MHYFLRLIAPLVQPIHLFFWSLRPIERFMRLVNALSGCIHSIGLTTEHFNSALIDGALDKYKCKKLEIFGTLSSVNVPKFIHWLTNGQSKKYLYLWERSVNEAPPIQLLDEVKKDSARATSKRRFVVRLKLGQQLDEFTAFNESTGEKLELRLIGVKDDEFIHALRRSPNNEMDNIEADCAEYDPYKMSAIFFFSGSNSRCLGQCNLDRQKNPSFFSMLYR